jgi:DNA mismatch endonuclease (patch repair protein)
MDILGPAERSALMSRIRNADTGIELLIRRGLHRLGFRYRLGGAGLPGRPDIVLPKYGTVVFVHGCFWHGHSCPLFRLPKTRSDFWAEKIESNRQRDRRSTLTLRKLGWRVITVWECQLRGASPDAVNSLILRLARRINPEGKPRQLATRQPHQ